MDRRVDDSFRSLERVSGDVHFQQVLRFLETRLANGLATFSLYEKILNGARERDQPTLAHTELKLSGLVKRDEEGCLVVRNRIYERLFDRALARENRTDRALAEQARRSLDVVRERLTSFNVTGGPAAKRGKERESAFRRAGSRRPSGRTSSPAIAQGVGPVTELALSGTKVADAAPLANLTYLQWA